MSSHLVSTQSFSLKGRLFTLTVLKIINKDIGLLNTQIDAAVASAPSLFSNAPIVIDFTALNDADLDIIQWISAIKNKGLLPVALQTNDATLSATAASLGLASLNASSTHDKDIQTALPTSKGGISNNVHTATKMRKTPVRSGQQIANREGCLVVMASVSPGAEVLSVGNIHIYGALRGRALAGLSGDETVSIFCQSLDAELVSIAGFYKLSDELPVLKQPCQIYLKNEQIHIETL